MKYGFVYVLCNQSMPGIFKIGMTARTPMQRCEELSKSTSAAEPFELMMYLETKHPLGLEKHMHDLFCSHRVNDQREFFRVDLREIHKAFLEWETEGCILAVSHAGMGIMVCADYEEKTANLRPAVSMLEEAPCSSLFS